MLMSSLFASDHRFYRLMYMYQSHKIFLQLIKIIYPYSIFESIKRKFKLQKCIDCAKQFLIALKSETVNSTRKKKSKLQKCINCAQQFYNIPSFYKREFPARADLQKLAYFS